MNRGKASASPPVQLTGSVPSRNIQQYSIPSRGQTPPYREDLQSTNYQQNYIQQPTFLHGPIQPNLPHDINKLAMQQQAQRLPPAGSGQSQIMYSQPRPQNPQSMQNTFYGQPQGNMRAPRPAMPAAMGMPQPSIMYLPSGSFSGPTQLHMNAMNPYFSQPQPGQRLQSAHGHYPAATTQTNQQYQMGPNPHTPPFYQNQTTPNTMFFPQSQAMPQPQRPPSASSIPSQQPYQKREKNVLKIVDPNTGKNILEDVVGGTATRQTPPQSGSSSARTTPVSSATTPAQGSEVGAQFAAQVAACLDTAAPRYPQQSPNMQPMPAQMHMQMAPQHVHLTHKPEGPVEGMATVQMPPKVPSPSQYQRSSVTPPNSQMMNPPPQNIAHVQPPGRPAQFVVHTGPPVIPQGYKAPAQQQPHIQMSQNPQAQMPPPQVQEPTVITNIEISAHDVPSEEEGVPTTEVSPTTDVRVGVSEQSNVIVPEQREVVNVQPKQEVADETDSATSAEIPVDNSSSQKVIETSSSVVAEVEQKSEIIQNSEINEKVDSNEDSKNTDKSDMKSSDDTQGEMAAPTLSKPEAKPSAIESEKSEIRTTPKVVELPKTMDGPQVISEVKPEETETSCVVDSSPVVDITPVVTEEIKPADIPNNKDTVSQTEVKAVAKPKNKGRGKALNAKGETKEGSDMDVFIDQPNKKADVDIKPVVAAEVEAPVSKPVAPEVESPVVVVEPAESIMTSSEEKDGKIEVDNRVVEENEKNEVKSNEKTVETNNVEETPTPKPAPELKYDYKEDQWSPVNPEGKKQYDRAFLLTLQYSNESTVKPDGLPNLPDVILSEPHSRDTRRSFDSSYQEPRGSSFDFTPGYVRPSPRGGSSSMGGGGGGGKNRSQQGRKEIKKITSVSIQQDIKLHHAEQAWKPQMAASKTGEDPEKAKTSDLYRRVTSILNKLTPQKFQTLVNQMNELPIDTEDRLKGVIDLVFEKAVSEPGFCVAYANMCKYLMMLKVPVQDKPGQTVNFRKLLISQCQQEFDKDNSQEIEYLKKMKEIEQAEESKRAQMREELEFEATKARRRSLGNIRFIGELFKLKMLTEKIMHHCVVKLLKSHDEESLECLCRLLTTIGKELDTDESKTQMNEYFKQLLLIVSGRKTSSRVRFMIQDLVDLRLSRWVPRRDENNPKTIDQIHKEVAKEAEAKAAYLQAASNQPMPRGGRGGRDRDRGGRPQGMANVGEDGWNTVAVKAPRATIDPNRLRLSKQQNVDENIQLGPSRNFSAWGRGSSAGGTKSQEGERPSTPGNRFSALSRDNDSNDPRSRGRGRGISPARSDPRSRNSSSRDPPRSKQGHRSSMEMERQNALATAKSHTMSGSTPPSRESSRSRDSRQEVKATPPANNLSEAEIEKKTKAIVDEFLNIHDAKEALSCIEELVTPSNLSRFVGALLSYVIERSKEARKQTATLLHDAVKKKIITVDLYISGLNQVLEFSEDMEIDIPQIWKYLGEFIEPMVYDGCVPLNFLKQACDCLKANKRAGILVSELLHELSNKMGHQKVTELWRSSGLVWTDFLPASDVQQFIKDKKLEFVLEDEPPKSPGLSAEHINMELEKLIITKDSDNEEVFDWIERNVEPEVTQSPRFIRSLMTIVCRSAITGQSFLKVDEDVIKKRDNLLQKYLDHNGERELQALYALQALAKKLEYPQGLLMSFFGVLYDESIISEDAFRQWERSKDPAEQDGKGAALKQVVQFLMFVKEENSGGEATADS